MRKSALLALGAMIATSPLALAQGLVNTPQSSPSSTTVKKTDRNTRVQQPAQVNLGNIPTAHRTAHAVARQPIRIAPIVGRTADGLPIPGEWRPYRPSGNGSMLLGDDQKRLFDAYEGAIDVCQVPPAGDLFPANGPLSGGVSPACDFGDPGMFNGDCGTGDTNRWSFLDTSLSGYMQKIVSLAGGKTSGTAGLVTHAWINNVTAGGTTACGQTVTNSVIAITIFGPEVGDIIGTGNPITLGDLDAGFKDGVILDFGEILVDPNAPGYGFANVDLTGDLVLDITNGDAYEVLYLAGDDMGNILGLADWMQSMLWFPKNAELQGESVGAFYIDGFNDPGDCSTFGIGDGDPDDPTTPFYAADEAADFTGLLPGLCPDSVIAMTGFYEGEVSGVPGLIESCSLIFGTDPNNNGCDPLNLAFDDDNVERYRSRFGFTALEPNIAEVQYTGSTGDPFLTSMAAIRVRDNGNTPNTVGKVRVRNYTTNGLVEVGIYNVSTPGGIGNDSENVISVSGGSDFVDIDTGFEVRVRYVCPSVFTALGFDIWADQVEVLFN